MCVQVHRDFRKPLIVMAPKNLLRHPAAKSKLSEFDDIEGNDTGGTRFRRLIMDDASYGDNSPKVFEVRAPPRLTCITSRTLPLDRVKGK